MLSTEKPPLDLLCSSSSPVIGQVCSDEKGSNRSNQKVQHNLDLLQPSPDDENKKQVSNFSIRDYVFSSRGKDIKTHWPFSPKNLQLCLKHGVSDVLPPFQTTYSVRNPLPVYSQAQEFPTSNKVVRTKNPSKSCKLLVAKPTTEPKPSNKEPMRTTSMGDPMGSKVCPVCKSFSSSSNTTLNAHIDQCLSEGPASNSRVMRSKVVKHRIKPRKIRLMVDIYETALCCTLEDLDKRNGTNWASSSNPGKDKEANLSAPSSADNNEEDYNGMSSSVNVADNKDEDGAVYVDSTGTKLRILSKSSDLRPNAKSTDDHRPKKKLVKCDKARKFLSNRKKHLLQRRKLFRASSHAKSTNGHCPKAKNDKQENVSSREGSEKRDQRHHLELCGRKKFADLGLVKKWVGSKRTVPKKKKSPELERRRAHKAAMEHFGGKKRLSLLSSNHEFGKETNSSSLPRTEKNDYGKESHPSLPKRIDSSKDVVRIPRYQASSCRKSPSLDHEISPHGKKLPSSKRSIESETKQSKLKKRRLRYASESDEEYIAPPSKRAFNIPSNDRFKDDLKDSLAPIGRRTEGNSDSYVRINTSNCTLNTEAAVEEVEVCKEDEGPDLIALDKYLDSPLPPYDECVPQHYVKAGDKEPLVFSEANDVIMGIDEYESERGDYYANIDRIPIIPGPPGSFLPSPGRRDELQQRPIHYEDDEHEVIDMDSSDSPISSASNVSNSIVDASDSASVIDPSRHLLPGVHGKIVNDYLKNDTSSTQSDLGREEQRRESRASAILSDVNPHGLINSGQPCSCSRKDGVYRSSFLGYQDPQLVGQRTMKSLTLLPTQEKQSDWNAQVKKKHSSERNEVIANFSEVPRICHELPSPSTAPNPVLRLMGKNLMVVNKDENFSPEIRPIPHTGANGHLYTRSFSDKNWQSSYEGPSVLDDRSQTTVRASETGASDGFRTYGGLLSKPELFPQKSFNGRSFANGEYPGKLVANPVELIVIDGSPRNETGEAANPFYMYTTHDHHPISRGAVQNSYYANQVPYNSMGMMRENAGKWKHMAENSRMLSSQNSLTASASLLPGVVGSSSPYASHGFSSGEKNFS